METHVDSAITSIISSQRKQEGREGETMREIREPDAALVNKS